MTEHPIIFTGPMVRAILDGRKTQTRRVTKIGDSWRILQGAGDWIVRDIGGDVAWDHVIRCPYGVPGDRLWVRETWMPVCHLHDWQPRVEKYGITYKADDLEDGLRPFHGHNEAIDYFTGMDRWRPSIHMPRWASRLTLEVTDVRVERVQDIGDVMKGDIFASCIAEGYPGLTHIQNRYYIEWFVATWNSINKKRGYGWDKNPWVWVVTFKRVEDT